MTKEFTETISKWASVSVLLGGMILLVYNIWSKQIDMQHDIQIKMLEACQSLEVDNE